jgi:hypothetical protein
MEEELAAKKPATKWDELRERLRVVHILVPLRVLVLAVVTSVLLAGAWPLKFGALFGPFPVAMLALTVVLLLGTGIAMLTRMSNFPWFLVLLFVAFGLSFFDNHNMRFVPNTEEAVRARVTASDLLSEFAADGEDSSPRPIILVATAGGGSRAAYWTAGILGELGATIDNFDDKLFLISGVSGGSVGAIFYRAALTAAAGDGNNTKDIAKAAASGDFLSPTLASMFIRDLIPGLPLSDRAEALERAWAESFDQACGYVLSKDPSGAPLPCPVNLEDGFLALWKSGPRWPALVLNGTVVESGSRAVASNLKLNCANGPHCYIADIADILKCEKRDLVASSAANVSARFPIVGPSARAKIDCEKRDLIASSAANASDRFATIGPSALSWHLLFPLLNIRLIGARANIDEGETVRNIVDGGYFDNFGAITLTQIMAELEGTFREKKLVPIVIQISSDPEFQYPPHGWRGHPYAGTSEPGGHQILKPMRTMQNLRGALGRQAFLNLKAQTERMGGAYFHFGQCTVPGGSSTRAPLGWVLSKSSRELLDAYSSGQCGNAGQIKRVEACLKSPKPGCNQIGKSESLLRP